MSGYQVKKEARAKEPEAEAVVPTPWTSGAGIVGHIGRYIETWNDDPTPFIWTKEPADLIKKIVRRKH